MYKVGSKIRRLSTQWGLGTTNKQITSSLDTNTEIGGCPMRAAIMHTLEMINKMD